MQDKTVDVSCLTLLKKSSSLPIVLEVLLHLCMFSMNGMNIKCHIVDVVTNERTNMLRLLANIALSI